MDDFLDAFMRFLDDLNESFIDLRYPGPHLLLFTSILEINEGRKSDGKSVDSGLM